MRITSSSGRFVSVESSANHWRERFLTRTNTIFAGTGSSFSSRPMDTMTEARILARPRRFLLLLSASVIQRISRLTSDDRADVLIVDDSLFSRSRSKKVELLARVYDHVSHKFVRGFRMLTLGWSNGNSFVPLAFSLISSENKVTTNTTDGD